MGNDVDRDPLAGYLETDEGRARLAALDSRWGECMDVAREAGFVTQAYGGVAVLCTNLAYMEANGADELARRLRASGMDLGIGRG